MKGRAFTGTPVVSPVAVAAGTVGRVRWWLSGRDAATSVARYGSGNLGARVGDDPERVRASRGWLAREIGVALDNLRFMEQVHGCDVADIDETTGEPRADAMVTTRTDVALAVLVADCTPVMLADPEAGVVGVAHAGRQGMVKGVVPATVQRMRDLGATDIHAVVGPSICGRCYEVPEEMRAEAAAVSPASYAVTWTGTPAIDVAAGVVEQLTGLGVTVQWLPGCSFEDENLYSYRRDGVTGRYAGVVRLLP